MAAELRSINNINNNNTEEYMNEDCCEPKTKNNKKGVKKFDSFLVGIGLFTLVILGGVVFFGVKMGETTEVVADTSVSMNINDNTYDWGTIDINAGKVTKTFTIENNGSTPLKLYDVKTSCTCTTAQLISDTDTSKKFSMHEKGASVFEVEPGKTAELLIEFDPAFHGPNGVGAISRTISMSTNDANNPELSFQLTANVIKK